MSLVALVLFYHYEKSGALPLPGFYEVLRRFTPLRAGLRRKEGPFFSLPSAYPFSAQARLGPHWANLWSRLTALGSSLFFAEWQSWNATELDHNPTLTKTVRVPRGRKAHGGARSR